MRRVNIKLSKWGYFRGRDHHYLEGACSNRYALGLFGQTGTDGHPRNLSFHCLLLCNKSPQNLLPKINNYFIILRNLWASNSKMMELVGSLLCYYDWDHGWNGLRCWDNLTGPYVRALALAVIWVPQLLSTWRQLWLELGHCKESNVKRATEN